MGGAYLSSWLINLRHCHSCTNFAKKTIEFLLHASIWLDNRFIFCTKMVDSEKRRPVRRTVYIPYQWQIDHSLFNFWHCRKLWLFQPALFLLFLFSYFIFVIQAAYLWVCLVGLGEPITRQFVTDSQLVKRKKNQGLNFCLKKLRVLGISCDGILILKLNWKLVTKLYR